MPWIKLYTEILSDPKMGMMDDHLWRFSIELFALAGKEGHGGILPDTQGIAWVLHRDPQSVQGMIDRLVELKIISLIDGEWIVTHFAERQDADSNAERQKRYRERKHNVTYYGNEKVTESIIIDNEIVTNSNEKSNDLLWRIEENRGEEKEKEKKKESRPPDPDDIRLFSPAPAAPSLSLEAVICNATGLAAIPPKEYNRIEQVRSLIDKYGQDRVIQAMSCSFKTWICTKTKNGNGTYRATNLGWVDWAQEELLKEANAPPPAHVPTPEEQAEYDAYVARIKSQWPSQR
jgi:hypothetical protein